MPKSVPLETLRPRWLTTGGLRYGMGASILCPGHMGLDHRLEFWFLSPMDGDSSADHAELYHCAGDSFDDLTLAPVTGQWGDLIDIPEHWRGWIIEGRVYTYRGPTVVQPPSGAG